MRFTDHHLIGGQLEEAQCADRTAMRTVRGRAPAFGMAAAGGQARKGPGKFREQEDPLPNLRCLLDILLQQAMTTLWANRGTPAPWERASR